MKDCDLLDVIRAVCTEMNAFAEEKKIKLEVSASSPHISGTFDGERMMQVVRNLLSNAIKFSEPGTSVIVQANKTENRIICRVINHGVEIPEGELNSIFDKFVQSSRTRSGAGG